MKQYTIFIGVNRRVDHFAGTGRPIRASSAFMSSHTSRFFVGSRKRYEGWNVHITGMPL